MILVVFVSLFGISLFMGYLMSKPTVSKNSGSTIYSIAEGNQRVHTLPKGMRSKVNVIVRLEFELAYYDVSVQHVRPIFKS